MNRTVNFTFVILHYVALAETYKCISSIERNCRLNDYKIIIVDNKSPNSTGVILAKKFKGHSHVKVILNNENLGFAKGNNIGIAYAVKNYAPDFIAVLNNDIVIMQNNFIDLVYEEYERSQFSVLAPKVLLSDGSADHYSFDPTTISLLRKEVIINHIKIILLYLGLYFKYLRFKGLLNTSNTTSRDGRKNIRNENVVLQGSCLIFSKKYFDFYSDGFDHRTFMYKEEQLLFLRLKTGKLLSVYNPNLMVTHNAEASTKQITGSVKGKLLFLHKNQIKSSNVLMSELKKMSKNCE